MRHTALDKRVYEAEGRTTDTLGLAPLNQRRTLGLLYRQLPPHLSDALDVVPKQRPLGGRVWRRQATVEVILGVVHLEILIPADVLVVTHEIAHILLDTSRDSFADSYLPDHGPLFRTTHLWVVRRAVSLRAARLLSIHYTNEGLIQ